MLGSVTPDTFTGEPFLTNPPFASPVLALSIWKLKVAPVDVTLAIIGITKGIGLPTRKAWLTTILGPDWFASSFKVLKTK